MNSEVFCGFGWRWFLAVGICLMLLVINCRSEKPAFLVSTDSPATDAAIVVSNTKITHPGEAPSLLKAVWPGRLAAEYYQTCLLQDDGSVVCWGKIAEKPKVLIPQGIVQITAGPDFTYALTAGKKILCWNALASPLTCGHSHDRKPCPQGYRVRPTEVPGFLPDVVAISAGERHLCAVLADGRIQCQGRNLEGQLGIGKESKATEFGKVEEVPPTLVVDLPERALAVTAGRWHTCALLIDKRLACWGFNKFGQLGNGTTTRSSKPVLVKGLPEGVISASTGANHTCAVSETGRVFCWGFNEYGQIGNGQAGRDQYVLQPTEVLGLSGPAVGVFWADITAAPWWPTEGSNAGAAM